MKILVVEDEPYVADLIRRGLEEIGLGSLVANNADSADILLTSQAIEGITLDIGMPGRDGMQWLEELTEHHPDLTRRTLVITGMPLAPEAVERLARWGAGVLIKPFTLTALHDAVRSQMRPGGEPGRPRVD